jgi:hypothetical protein
MRRAFAGRRVVDRLVVVIRIWMVVVQPDLQVVRRWFIELGDDGYGERAV